MATARTSSRTLIVAGALIAAAWIALGVVLLTADDDRSALLAARRERIAGMTETQRDRLKHLNAQYQKLDADERADVADLHESVQADERLKGTMLAYSKWIKTLSPYQQEQLRTTTDPGEKLKFVQQMRAKQDSGSDAGDGRMPSGFRSRFSRFTSQRSLSSADLTAIVKVVESKLERPPPPRKLEIDRASGPERHLLVLHTAMKSAQRRSASSRVRWPSSELLDEMIAAVDNADVRSRLEDTSPERKRGAVMFLVLSSLGKELREAGLFRSPNEQEIQNFFEQLEGAERDKLMNLSLHDQKRRLEFMWRMKNPPKYSREFSELFRAATGSGRSFGRGRGGRSGRPPFKGPERGDSGRGRP